MPHTPPPGIAQIPAPVIEARRIEAASILATPTAHTSTLVALAAEISARTAAAFARRGGVE
ncbi:hypothetical protein P7L78_22125 [Tistrella bauzanensis]|uniref:hypothetical protein n=1 Tax=Tistrella TaxID=171436 RepID=UPI0031F63E81